MNKRKGPKTKINWFFMFLASSFNFIIIPSKVIICYTFITLHMVIIGEKKSAILVVVWGPIVSSNINAFRNNTRFLVNFKRKENVEFIGKVMKYV
jgi:hypothetical protein